VGRTKISGWETIFVIPAQAGIQEWSSTRVNTRRRRLFRQRQHVQLAAAETCLQDAVWIPAFAGMTNQPLKDGDWWLVASGSQKRITSSPPATASSQPPPFTSQQETVIGG
jgi:hypothetical protein